MALENQVRAVLEAYQQQSHPLALEYLGGAGGFSGAQLWRLQTSLGQFCLRRWPAEHPDQPRLQLIHDVLQHVSREGFCEAAVPLRTDSGDSFVRMGGRFWELTSWMSGAADYQQNPSLAKLQAAMEMLARFHRAATSFSTQATSPSTAPLGRKLVGAPPAIRDRVGRLKSLLEGEVQEIGLAPKNSVLPRLVGHAERFSPLFFAVAPLIERELAVALNVETPLQVCIRDIWSDHVFFSGERVSGLVDFGAMRVDSVACDVARLLGSLAGDDVELWRVGIDAYEKMKPLTDEQKQLIVTLDRSTTLMAPANWLAWIFVEGRQFEDWAAIASRLEKYLKRLEQLSSGQRIELSQS